MKRKNIFLFLSAMVVGVVLGAGYPLFFGPIAPGQAAAKTESAARTESAVRAQPAASPRDHAHPPGGNGRRQSYRGRQYRTCGNQAGGRASQWLRGRGAGGSGDDINSGDLLVALERDDLRRAVDQATSIWHRLNYSLKICWPPPAQPRLPRRKRN